MLRFERFNSVVLSIPLTGRPLSGTFPWECQWLIDKVVKTPGDILEIGTFKGATARELATALPERTVHCVDIHDPAYGLTLEQVGEESRGLSNVKLTITDSKSFPFPENLGIIFIDGDHSWAGVKADTELALNYFRGRKGSIIWHDYDPTHEVMPFLDWVDRHYGVHPAWLQCTQIAFLDFL